MSSTATQRRRRSPARKPINVRNVPEQWLDTVRPLAQQRGYGRSDSAVIRFALITMSDLIAHGIDPVGLRSVDELVAGKGRASA